MNRVFLSLYIVIVVSVVGLGWGADKLWLAYNPEPEVHPFERMLFHLIEKESFWRERFDLKEQERVLSAKLGGEVYIYTLEDFAASSLVSQLQTGNLVNIFDASGQRLSYKRIVDTSYVLQVVTPSTAQENGFVYFALLITFYCAIAVTIYFWVWPLSRDLRRLQHYTQKVGADLPEKIHLTPSSAVYDLAAAFNRMAERIDELLASHKEMTYAVSHELRTPLARMKFALEMLPETDVDTPTKTHIDSLRADVSEMDKLINELLAYAGFEQKQQALEMKPGDMASLLENLLKSNIAAQNATNISYSINDSLNGELVYCEWYLMERALHNLIQNAVKYAASSIHVSLSKTDTNYIIKIDDDGPGIPEADRDKVFDAFVRLRQDEKENKSGFGLGLAIVRRIVRWHGGEVGVESSPLGGAMFRLSWPELRTRFLLGADEI